MAVNILDAFVVTFGLDSRDYERGKRDLDRSLRDTKDNAKSTFDDIERRGKAAGQTFRQVRNEVVGLVLAFAGARSVTDFALNMIHGEAAAGRLAQTIGTATENIFALQGAIKGVNGKPEDANQALQGLSGLVQNKLLTGDSGHDADLLGLGIRSLTKKDANGNQVGKDPFELLMQLSEARNRFSGPEYAARLGRLGLPESVINFLMKGNDEVKKQIALARENAAATQRDADAAKKLEDALGTLQTTIEGKVRPVITRLVESFTAFLEAADKANALMPLIVGGLVAVAAATAAAIGPWGLLAAAIAGAAVALTQWQTKSGELAKPGQKGWGIPGLLWFHSADDATSGGVNGNSSTADIRKYFPGYQPRVPKAVSASGASIERALIAGGLSAEQARGVAAALAAESSLNPNARNPKSGAFGLGQWLGSRKDALFRRFGPNPTTAQQIQFLLSELNGGDPGGAAVLRQNTAGAAMWATVTNFLRPQGKNWEHGRDWAADIRRGNQYLRSGGDVHVNGPITINTRATDARGIARDFASEVKRRGVVTQADGGVAP